MAPAPLHSPQIGSGKVTDSQVAFMVECYLRDSHFSRTLEEFRSEAARLLHPLRAVPKGARSLSAVLNDYVALKEEQIAAAAEKARVEDLFNGLQEIMSVFISGAPKSSATMGEVGNVKIACTLSPPHVLPAAATNVQQPQLCGLNTPEAGNASASADQRAKQKPSSSKRKSLDNSSHEYLQQGDSGVDPAKKSRRDSALKRLSTDAPSTGNIINVDSPTGSIGNVVNTTVQPATPPMSTINTLKLQQQQACPSHTTSGSPPASLLPTEARPSAVTPKHTSGTLTPTPPPLLSVRGDCVQGHQDPQTPPPSSINSFLSNNCTSATSAKMQGKPSEELQRKKASLPHIPSSTCPYALRAHKKPVESLSAALLNAPSTNCTQRATRKKANNSKCRLLDFSTAAVSTNQVRPSKKENKPSVSPSECVEVSIDFQQTCGTSAEGVILEQSGHGLDISPSSAEHSQKSEFSEFALPCDTFSFDELFDLDLDTSLISELEDLSAFSGNDMDQPTCLKNSEMAAIPLSSEASTRSILSDIGNFVHSDEAASLLPQLTNLSASPSKLRKPPTLVSGNELNKENMLAVVDSSSPQTILIS